MDAYALAAEIFLVVAVVAIGMTVLLGVAAFGIVLINTFFPERK